MKTAMLPERHSAEAAATALLSSLLASAFDRAIKPPSRSFVARPTLQRSASQRPFCGSRGTRVTAFDPSGHMLFRGLEQALEATFPQDKQGPLAAERVWFLAFA